MKQLLMQLLLHLLMHSLIRRIELNISLNCVVLSCKIYRFRDVAIVDVIVDVITNLIALN